MSAVSLRLPSYSLFAGMLAMAGLPIYIHAPKFYVDEYGVSLAALGAALFGLRLLDVVQDPALGWLSGQIRNRRATAVAIGGAVMALAMLGLFAVAPPFSPLLWFALTLALLFSAFSFLTITFYAQGVTKAESLGDGGHVRLAGWRETGALAGVSLAAIAPVALASASASPFVLFAVFFALLAVLAIAAMHAEWRPSSTSSDTHFRDVVSDPLLRRLLLIALLNSMPVAVTSTLFLFFVESRLAAPGWEGPLLLLFFLSAAVAAPLWSRLAAQIGAKRALQAGMALAIGAFIWAAFLGQGDVTAFAVICIASGAALGADMTLLPAMFARRAAEAAPEASIGFGLWSFVTKISLAFAAVVLLPLLQASGFTAGSLELSQNATSTLTAMYVVLPCILKLAALALLTVTPLDNMVAKAALEET